MPRTKTTAAPTAATETHRVRWELADPAPEEMRSRFAELHPLLVQLLHTRGITSQEDADRFLGPDFGRDLHDPFLFRHMSEACDRVWRALERGEKVVIHGDYDADGVCGSAVLMSTFRVAWRAMGKDASLLTSYLPHREKDGYGLRTKNVERLADEGAALMITVDCGISCAAEIAAGTAKGMDCIVVDHHQIPASGIPRCLILHPLVEGETYPYKSLAAVGVAYKFACAFISFASARGVDFGPGFDKWLLDLVSIATVTDIMPLVGENRTLEKFGLVVLNKTQRPGLKKLIEAARLVPGKLDTVSVGFAIGPRINAASRMDHARAAFDTIMAEDEESAERLAAQLDQLNRDRQLVTEQMVREARTAIERDPGKKVYVIAKEGWSPGIVGLAAGRMANEFGVPVFVLGGEEGVFIGSGRSIPGFNLVAAMETASAHLARYGGHPQACGLTVHGAERIDAFRAAVEAYAERELAGRDLRPTQRVDAELRTSQITWDLAEQVLAMEPYGEGNPRPVFLLREVLVTSVTPVGKDGKHVRIGVRGDTPKEWKVIAFNKAAQMRELPPGTTADLLVELGFNEWNGTKEIQLKAVDFRRAK